MASTMKMEETLLQIMLSFSIYLGLLLCCDALALALAVAVARFYSGVLNRGFQHFNGCWNCN